MIVNGENSAGGRGISLKTARELRDAGADIITLGNHTWSQPDITQVLEDDDLRVVRPMNYPDPAPGRGIITVTARGRSITVANVMGRVRRGSWPERPVRSAWKNDRDGYLPEVWACVKDRFEEIKSGFRPDLILI